MAKIKLGVRPETFKPFPVKFTMPDGTEGVITPSYRYRTRKEFGEMLNEAFAEAAKNGVETDKEKDKIDFQALYSNIGAKNAEHLLKSITAWDLDVELNIESLVELCDTLPAASAALMAAYSSACSEGKLGN